MGNNVGLLCWDSSPTRLANCDCYTFCMEKIKIEHHTVSGGLWMAAWMFTIGYLHLTFWQGVLALLIWPYYLGVAFHI